MGWRLEKQIELEQEEDLWVVEFLLTWSNLDIRFSRVGIDRREFSGSVEAIKVAGCV